MRVFCNRADRGLRNPHASRADPKSSASTNFATPPVHLKTIEKDFPPSVFVIGGCKCKDLILVFARAITEKIRNKKACYRLYFYVKF